MKKRPFYRKWYQHDGYLYTWGKFWPSGRALLISFQEKKVRINDDVTIHHTQYDYIADREKLPVCKKAEFEKALELAEKKLKWLSKQP